MNPLNGDNIVRMLSFMKHLMRDIIGQSASLQGRLFLSLVSPSANRQLTSHHYIFMQP